MQYWYTTSSTAEDEASTVVLIEVPLWAYLASELADTICWATGCRFGRWLHTGIGLLDRHGQERYRIGLTSEATSS